MLVKTARVASEQEKISLLKHLAGQTDFKKQKSINYCIQNADRLKAAYLEFYDAYRKQKYKEYVENETRVYNNLLQRFQNHENDYKERNENWNERLKIVTATDGESELICQCGSPMRYVHTYDFIGCTNYQDFSVKHDSFNRPVYYEAVEPILNLMEFDCFCTNFEFSKLYINYFRKEYDIPKDIMASILFEFLHMIWKLPKIASDVDGQYFTTGIKSKYQSNKEESILKAVLKTKFKTVLEQPMLIYNIEGDHKTKCFPDFICSNETTVLVLEVKKDPFNADPDQLYKYKVLVEYLNEKHKLNKKVIAKHYFYNIDPYAEMYQQSEEQIMAIKDGISLENISTL